MPSTSPLCLPPEGPLLPPISCEPVDEALPTGVSDDATAAYVLAVRPAFDGLRDAAGQLADLMILAAAGGRSWKDGALLGLASDRLDEARARLGAARPTPPGRHHHRHLSAGASLLADARARVGAAPVGVDRDEVGEILARLREATLHLRAAGDALPGFDMVAICACCGGGAGGRRPPGPA